MLVSDMKGVKAGRLRLAVITTAKYFIPRLLGQFCQDYPGIDVSLKVTNRERVLQRMAENQDDLYVLGALPEEADVVVEPFLENPLVVVAARGRFQQRSAEATTGTGRKPVISWAALLDEAVKKPGFIHEAYSRFHNYSLGNQLLALFQCFERGVQPGPLATWPKWKELGRYVKKGEKALTLCMPVACKRTRTVTKQDGTEQDEEFTYTHFAYKAHWFVLGQTDGAELKPAAIPGWSEQKALETLKMMEEEDYEKLVNEKGAYFLAGLRELQRRHPGVIGQVDGLGLALRIEVCKPDGLTPDRELVDRIFAEGVKGELTAGGKKYGLVLDVGGYYKNVFTLAPSFTITRAEMDLAIDLLDQLFRSCIQS